ncbi:5'-flap endonuclease [Sporothrix epigloea]|uniref:Structure-specific endonuclease subunit SLX4 n=1 Tax=Sporothrix epigloea TaxID=1892477 RepID=A0ABP0DEN5_9PEZI
MDLRNVILLSSSPVLPQQRQLTSLPAKCSTPRPLWNNKHLLSSDTGIAMPETKSADCVLLESTPDAAAGDSPRPSQAYSKYFDEPRRPLHVHDSATEIPLQVAAKACKSKPEVYVTGDLELAVQRRRDWTPPPNDTVITPPSGSIHDTEDWSSSPGDILSRRNNVFQSLQTSFGHKADDEPVTVAFAAMVTTDSAEATRSSDTAAREPLFVKRKAIEAITIGDTGRRTSPTKTKAPKKVRTLTELAVAAYVDVPTEKPHTVMAAAEKLQPSAIDESLPLAEVEVRHRFPTSKLRKLKSATAATAASKKNKPRARKAPASRKPVLLSPVSARAASNAQDFLFGTSSQLARDYSPSFLRHLHTAMHESNRGDTIEKSACDNDTERNCLLDILADMSSEADAVDLTGQRAPAPGDSKRLWGAAARGADGHLSFNNVINLEDAIEFPEDPHQVIAMAQRAAAETVQKNDIEATSVSTLTATAAPTQKPRATQFARGKSKLRAKEAERQVQPGETQAELAKLPTPIQTPQTDLPAPPASVPLSAPTMAEVANAAKATKSRKAVKIKEAVRPNFEILSLVQLAKKVSDYGYKAMKSRPAMIALLNQCWEAQHLPLQSQVQQTTSLSTPSASAPAPAPASTHAITQAQTAAGTVDGEPPAKAQAQKQAQTKPKTVRVAKPKATKVMPAAKVTQTTITGSMTLPRASTSNGKTVAPYHTTTKASARSPVKLMTKAKFSSKVGRHVFEIDDSESDGRFSSPESTTTTNTASASVLWGLVEAEEEVVSDSDFQDIDDIVASDLDGSDSDSNSVSKDDMSLVVDAPLTYEESALFQYIYTAVTQQPRTSDPTAPSWHEKMLMYDTIILESFTAWLNDGPLQAAGYAGTAVDPRTVKKWCEAKSVCCIWRKNQHGKERKW